MCYLNGKISGKSRNRRIISDPGFHTKLRTSAINGSSPDGHEDENSSFEGAVNGSSPDGHEDENSSSEGAVNGSIRLSRLKRGLSINSIASDSSSVNSSVKSTIRKAIVKHHAGKNNKCASFSASSAASARTLFQNRCVQAKVLLLVAAIAVSVVSMASLYIVEYQNRLSDTNGNGFHDPMLGNEDGSNSEHGNKDFEKILEDGFGFKVHNLQDSDSSSSSTCLKEPDFVVTCVARNDEESSSRSDVQVSVIESPEIVPFGFGKEIMNGMASSDMTGSSILDDFSAEDRLAGDAEVSHGSLLDDEREADIGLEVQADNGISGDTSGGDDADLEAIKARVREMEEEALKFKELQSEVDRHVKAIHEKIKGPALRHLSCKIC